jgi:hypothetical protein
MVAGAGVQVAGPHAITTSNCRRTNGHDCMKNAG